MQARQSQLSAVSVDSRLSAPERSSEIPTAEDIINAVMLDVLQAACEVVGPEHVYVVTAEDSTAAYVRRETAHVVADPLRGLNSAVRVGLEQVAADSGPSVDAAGAPLANPVAVLVGDLPGLRSSVLQDALRMCGSLESAYLADSVGKGTVLLTHHDPLAIVPAFGGASAQRHGRWAVRVHMNDPGIITDVDSYADLQATEPLWGVNTQACMRGLSWQK